MSTTLHNFVEIFKSEIETEEGPLKVNKIVIPIIQRDYAQGRTTPEINRVRERFLESLHNALESNPITLDFVYGDIDESGTMTPLDGQQRLTTLFLLHWYAAKRDQIEATEWDFLKNFSYETRYSARQFCNELVSYSPSFTKQPSSEIINQAWFPLEWKKDPTISSMLVMIDDIYDKFKDITNIWEKLKGGAISFYFLPIKDMDLTDELYIKMNSRGKPLTQFEHFKAELERNLKSIDQTRAKEIMNKIDIAWTDMLWLYRDSDNVIDDEFLRYFKFICDVICYQENGTPQGRSYDEFSLLKLYFEKDVTNVSTHIDILENYFDCWCGFDIGSFLSKYISNEHEIAKVQFKGDINIFKDCLNNYAVSVGRNRKFPLNRVVMLFAIIQYLLHKTTITEADFVRRLRIINNLVRNSENELSDSEDRTGGNKLPAILRQTEAIMLNGTIDLSVENSFNFAQLEEESNKLVWVSANPSLAETLYDLEDHPLLYGQIGIVGLENIALADKFKQLFQCDLDLVDSALMAIGNYGQRERNKWRYQYGTKNDRVLKAWQDLFHKSNIGYAQTKSILNELLVKCSPVSNASLQSIVDNYITECEHNNLFDIRYYYLKYDCFRPGAYGKYYWPDFDNKPYCLYVMQTVQQISQSSYQPFLYAIDNSEALSKDDYGKIIIRGNKYVVCENDGYYIKNRADKTEVDKMLISQNSSGIDTEDRIKKFSTFYKAFAW